MTTPEATECLTTKAGHEGGCVTAPRPINFGHSACSAVSGREGVSVDVSDIETDLSTMVTFKRPVPDGFGVEFGLEHLCKQDVLPNQQVCASLASTTDTGTFSSTSHELE